MLQSLESHTTLVWAQSTVIVSVCVCLCLGCAGQGPLDSNSRSGEVGSRKRHNAAIMLSAEVYQPNSPPAPLDQRSTAELLTAALTNSVAVS